MRGVLEGIDEFIVEITSMVGGAGDVHDDVAVASRASAQPRSPPLEARRAAMESAQVKVHRVAGAAALRRREGPTDPPVKELAAIYI